MTTTAEALSPADALRRIAARVPEHSASAEWAREPFHAHAHDAYWTVATDARVIAAAAGLLSPFQLNSAGARRVSPFLADFGAEDVVPEPLLREWAGAPVWSVPCPSCKGTCADEHVYCSFCDGDGDVYPGPRLGRLHRQYLDRNLLALALAACPAGDGLVRAAWAAIAKQDAAPLLLEPEGESPPWRVVLMPIKPSPDTLAESEKEHGPCAPFGAGLVDEDWLRWNDKCVLRLARGVVSGAWGDLPILADALRDAGCDRPELIDCCRPGLSRSWVALLIALDARVFDPTGSDWSVPAPP